jgi:hypothetical protein
VKETSNKFNIYRFQSKANTSTSFTLIPIEGNAQLFVNPGVIPTDNDKFYYKATHGIAKRIVVNRSDIESMKLPEPVSI